MKITNIEVYGLEVALRSMRNPMNSWSRIDSTGSEKDDTFKIGEADLNLAQRLIKGGSEHCKFLRQIHVWVDIEVPRYLWSEIDTYKYNTKNSTSTMHRLFEADKEITLENFYTKDLNEEDLTIIGSIIEHLNLLRNKWLNDGKNFKYVAKAKKILPECYLQMRTIDTNYAELRNIYFQRRHHRLKEEWGMICRWIESLPYAKELITYEPN